MFSDLSAWQAMLDRHREVFQELQPGSRIGIVPKRETALGADQCGSARPALFDPTDGVLCWEAREDGMRADYRACVSLQDAGVDVFLVADADALELIRASLEGEPLAVIRKLIRLGHILFFVIRTKNELREAGYEDFLDSLGLAFLGACR